MGAGNNEQNPNLPKDQEDLLGRIQNEWSLLMNTVENISPEQMSRPGEGGWTIKDNMAHLSAWEQFMLDHYLQGQPTYEAMQIDEATLKGLDENGINDILFRRYQDRPAAEVMSDLKHTHERVMAELNLTPFSKLMSPVSEEDPQKRPLILWVIGNTYDHYQEHRKTIEKLVNQP